MQQVSVIVPAAGSSQRFGDKESKIYQRIGGQPVFIRTLEAFTSRQDVCQVLLVVSAADIDQVKERFGANLGFMGVSLVEGGPTRSASVRNALARVSDQAELVCMHDAVRPCIAQEWVDAVFAEAAKTGAAILAYPVHGTLKAIAIDGIVERTLPRTVVWEAQTPQVFRKDILIQAYAAGTEATDDAALVEAAGHPVRIVMGDPRNIKITTLKDLAVAAAVIQTLPKPKPASPSHPFQEAQW
jgi:2-C-methyl-D-erythritol 4-phosphate cytidylyltransferase